MLSFIAFLFSFGFFQVTALAQESSMVVPRFQSNMTSILVVSDVLQVAAIFFIIPITFGLITVVSRRYFDVGRGAIGIILVIALLATVVVLNSNLQANEQFNYDMRGSIGLLTLFGIGIPLYMGIIASAILIVSRLSRVFPNTGFATKSVLRYSVTMIILIVILVSSATTIILPTNRMMRREIESRANEAVLFYEQNEAFFEMLFDVQQRLISHREDDTLDEIIIIMAGANPYRLSSENEGIISIADAYFLLDSAQSRGAITPENIQGVRVYVSTDNISFTFWRERTVLVSFFTAVSPVDNWRTPWGSQGRQQFYYDYIVELNENWRILASHLLRPH